MNIKLGERDYLSIAINYAKERKNLSRAMQAQASRFLDDLESVDSVVFDFRLDEDQAIKCCKYIEQHKHTVGRWAANKEYIVLEPWQVFFFVNVFGWVHKDDHTLRFKKIALSAGRKNGLTIMSHLMASTALHFGLYEKVFNTNKNKRAFEFSKKSFERIALDSSVRIQASVNSKLRPASLEIIDESKGGTFDNTPNPQCIFTNDSEQAELSVEKADRIDRFPDNEFVCLYNCDAADNLDDSSIWVRANPNINVSVNFGFLVEQSKKKDRFRKHFIIKHLNVKNHPEVNDIQNRADAAERKRKSRARLAKLGIKPVQVNLAESEIETLDMLCSVRAGEGKQPYSYDEYISTLIRRDKERLDKQIESAQCTMCNLPLPTGCGGVNSGTSVCYKYKLNNRLAL
ncbi:hypothetical protein [Pseudoalteromonas rhizosphaerae]|uniref:hypothetical protein n=1 Tax=Pseudoalteromonas rhizosphaerae TaxID=2518973 RepID=UPI001C55598E|nr:hypothetical protein [Pseudoalteromonas rhizosphaerae]